MKTSPENRLIPEMASVANGQKSVRRSVTLVNPLEDADWDKKISRFPKHSFFHTQAWTRVLSDTYGCRPIYLLSGDKKCMTGVLPMMEVDSWLTGKRGVGLPFTDFCASLGTETDELFHEACHLGRDRRWKYVEFRALAPGATPSVSFWGHALDLRRAEKDLFAGCGSSTKRAVRRAGQSGLEIEIAGSLDATCRFYQLLLATRKRHGLPPQPWRFFENIHAHILAHEKGFVVLARYSGRPIAGAVFFCLGSRSIYKFGASDMRFQHLRANNLVMWEATKYLANHGFEELHFGRTSTDNDGLRRFKLGWGTEEHRLDYSKFDMDSGAFVIDSDNASGWHNRVFSLLPAKVSRLFGAVLYRHVA